jgi:hypothetical protein
LERVFAWIGERYQAFQYNTDLQRLTLEQIERNGALLRN